MTYSRPNRRRFLTWTTGLLSAAATGRPAGAGGITVPTGKVILSISGKIDVTNTEGMAQFDRAMLEGLGLSGFTTTTPWYDAPMTFEGVRMDRLMEAVGATGELMRASALDDYTTEIPLVDFRRHGTILALRRNGKLMTVSDKGPLFIVYPFDSDSELKHQRFYSRCAWQVRRMAVI